MSEEINSVEMSELDSVLDDGALMPEYETEIAQPDAASVEDVVGEPEEEAQPEEPQEKTPAKEPGWIKKRIESGVEKELNKRLTDMEQRIAAQYEARMRPLIEAQMEREADQLVASGKMQDRDMALEYVKLKNNVPAEQGLQEQDTLPRNEKGQFAPKQTVDPEVANYANMLKGQADTIKEMTGLNVFDIYRNDPEVRRRIIAKEITFVDLAREYSGQQRPPVPSPMRSPNQGTPQPVNFMRMSSAQFRKLDDYLANGGRVRFE